MVRTVKNGREEDDFEEDHEFASTAPDIFPPKGKVEKTSDQKANPVRSKHSETEQRRRSKINERFQVLRDLIPENDQKRDKASFLLEVIQYIQFLQERIRAYEGTCQGWSPEPSKLMSWQRGVLGSIDHFLDQPQLIRDGSASEDNVAVSSKLLTSSQNSIDSDFSGSALYGTADNPRVKGSHGITPVQTNLFEVVSAHPSHESFPEPDFHLPDQFHSQQWLSKSSVEYVEGGHDPVNPEKLKPSSVESSISHDYSQRILNTLSNVLHSSGVDLLHTNISVQLDVSRQTDGGSHAAAATLDGSTFSEIGSYIGTTEKHGHANKKLKTRDSRLPFKYEKLLQKLHLVTLLPRFRPKSSPRRRRVIVCGVFERCGRVDVYGAGDESCTYRTHQPCHICSIYESPLHPFIVACLVSVVPYIQFKSEIITSSIESLGIGRPFLKCQFPSTSVYDLINTTHP